MPIHNDRGCKYLHKVSTILHVTHQFGSAATEEGGDEEGGGDNDDQDGRDPEYVQLKFQ